MSGQSSFRVGTFSCRSEKNCSHDDDDITFHSPANNSGCDKAAEWEGKTRIFEMHVQNQIYVGECRSLKLEIGGLLLQFCDFTARITSRDQTLFQNFLKG